jgi:hypothetical protein
MGGFKNLLSISIRHSNEVTKILCIDKEDGSIKSVKCLT